MVKLAMIIANDGFRDEEYFEPKNIFQSAGFEVVTASLSAKPCKGAGGAKVIPDQIVAELDEEELDAVIIVGGPGSTTLADSRTVLQILKDASDKGKVVAAICYGTLALAKSGLVSNQSISAFKDDFAEKLFKQHNVSFSKDGLTVLNDLRIVTAQGASFAIKFGEAVRDMLIG